MVLMLNEWSPQAARLPKKLGWEPHSRSHSSILMRYKEQMRSTRHAKISADDPQKILPKPLKFQVCHEINNLSLISDNPLTMKSIRNFIDFLGQFFITCEMMIEYQCGT
ncbi:Uncharacterized protein Fot_25859 [Forsythia ovata]|uniref:Uncharacterized protein n=1 Tax=Forsythia ovata TaxID=205694 RepID=A0ABD1UA87_9LAMI